MFWRQIPRATEVLASQRAPSPVGEPDPPPRPPRPARPYPVPSVPADSSGAHDGSVSGPNRTRPLLSLRKSNARLRRAAQEIIDMNRSQHQHRPEHFSDVVEQVMTHPEKISRPKTGLKRAKSVVSLFRRHSKPRESSSGGTGDSDPASHGAQPSRTSASLRTRRSSTSSLSASSVLSDSSGFDTAPHRDRFAPEESYAPASQHTPASRENYPEQQLEAMRLSTPGPGESLSAPRLPSWHREAPYAYEAPAPAPFGRSATRGIPSGSLHGQRTTHSRNSVTGLVNLGNSCYLASIVQVLLATPPLEKFFLDDDYLREINPANRLGSGGELAETFAELCKAAASGEFRSLSPAYLQEALARWAPQYSDESQQDAHECLLSLLDGLHGDLNLVLRPPPPVEVSPARELALQQLPEVVAADLVWKEYRDRQDSVIVDFFHGQVRNRMECLRCHTTSSTFHPLQTLSLALPRATTSTTTRQRQVPTDLQDCIADYLQEEILRGENAWRCPTCKSPQVASKRVSIARLPQFLVIHLQRSASYNARKKLTTPISFPLSGLELGGLLPPMALSSDHPSPSYELHVPHEAGTSYELYAAVCHHGEDGGGHYTTLVRRRCRHHHRRRGPKRRRDGGENSFEGEKRLEEEEDEERWLEIDDETVTPLETPDELDDALLRAEETAYLLFYRISDLSSPLLRD